MNLRIIVLMLALFGVIESNATTCIAYNPKSGEEISMAQSPGSPQLYFSMPKIVDGHELTAVYLRGFHAGSKKRSAQLLVPIVFSIYGDLAKAEMWILPEFIKVRIDAKYGNKQCGPRLYKDVLI